VGNEIIVQFTAAHELHYQKERMARFNHLVQFNNLSIRNRRERRYVWMIEHFHDAHFAMQL
jgi:hypothetical protein